jgi:hypothetical protein
MYLKNGMWIEESYSFVLGRKGDEYLFWSIATYYDLAT